MANIRYFPDHLGITHIHTKSIEFQIWGFENEPLEVLLWWSTTGNWKGTPLHFIDDRWKLEMEIDGKIEFTFCYRFDENWIWVAEFGKTGLVLNPALKQLDPSDLFTGNYFKPKILEFDDCCLYEFENFMAKPLSMLRYLAFVQHRWCWMKPDHGTSLGTINDCYFFIWQRDDGHYVCMYAVAGLEQSNCFLKIENGEISIDGNGIMIVATGIDYFKVSKQVFAHVRKMTGENINEILADSEWIDHIYYCTWNAMYQGVSQEKIVDALEKMPWIKYLLIDDGLQQIHNTDSDELRCFESDEWQHVHKACNGLQSFEANSKFPNGLKSLVDTLKQKFNLQRIGLFILIFRIWHALLGYWGGICPDSELAKKYKLSFDSNQNIWVVDESDVEKFYLDYHSFLAKCGISFVKIDNQHAADVVAQKGLWKAYQNAIFKSTMKHFDRRVIYCMALYPPIFNYALFREPKPCLRMSDDFFPDIDSSHGWHVFCNALNATYLGHLNVVPDWDMYQTHHKFGAFHTAARCLSGGFVTITDIADLSREESIEPIVSGGIVCKFSNPGMCRYPFIPFNSDRATKIFNGHNSSFCLGVFNTSEKSITDIVSIIDFSPDVGSMMIVYDVLRDELVTLPQSIDLDPNTFKIYNACPLIDGIAVLGMKNVYAGISSITRNNNIITVSHEGVYIFYSSKKVTIGTDEHIHQKQSLWYFKLSPGEYEIIKQ